jgi:hypothetical protein
MSQKKLTKLNPHIFLREGFCTTLPRFLKGLKVLERKDLRRGNYHERYPYYYVNLVLLRKHVFAKQGSTEKRHIPPFKVSHHMLRAHHILRAG